MRLTLQHPFFGVGAGVFIAASSREAEREGRPAHWRGTHNTFVQVSSETGLPGLAFYAAAMLFSLASTSAAWKRMRRVPGLANLSSLALALVTMMLNSTVGCFFGHFAYLPTIPMLIALLVTTCRAAEQEMLTHSALAPAMQEAGAVPGWAQRGAAR